MTLKATDRSPDRANEFDDDELVDSTRQLLNMPLFHQSTVEQLPLGIAYASRAGKTLWTNEAFCRILGYSVDELAGSAMERLTHAEDLNHSTNEFLRLWAGETTSYTQEKRYTRKDGAQCWVRVTASLLRSPSGSPMCAVGFLEDITSHKQVNLDAENGRRLLNAVITDVPAALLACDTAGNINLHNPAAATLYSVGTDRTHHAHTDAYPLAAAVYRADGVTPIPRSERPLARALRGETALNVEQVVVPVGGSPRTILASTRQLQGPEGECLGAVAVSQDITELRQREAEIERIHKQLMVASRQAGMADVATNVLHNVGNVLNSVNVSAALVSDLVKRSNGDGLAQVAALLQDQQQDLAAFITNDERGRKLPMYLARLAEQWRSAQGAALKELDSLRSHIDHIKETVAMQQTYAKRCGLVEQVNVSELIDDALRMNTGALTRHQVTLRREYADKILISTDKHRVLQILVNLVRNAKYACDESGRNDKEICIRVEHHGERVRIVVIDNGVGIEPEHLGSLFRHGFTTRKAGHGFGLHSAALAAQQLGGTLTADSAGAGCGATFALELPPLPPQDLTYV